MSDHPNAILVSLEPLFVEAERTGKWFWCHYQDLWFSPAALRKLHGEGRFIWGPVNWKLRDPLERIAEANKRAMDATRAAQRIYDETHAAMKPQP